LKDSQTWSWSNTQKMELYLKDSQFDSESRRAALLRLCEERRKKAELEANASKVLAATCDTYHWATNFTRTYNEHWQEEGRTTPYEPFPRKPYFPALFHLLRSERIHWFEKSRDMMLTWGCVAYLELEAMLTPKRGMLFQTQKEKKAVQLIDYAKCLYQNQPDFLQEAFPLSKPLYKFDRLTLEWANGAYCVGIPGGADQIRSFHPWGYLNDESSFQPDAGECYNEALSAVKGKVIFNSSAGPGWFADARLDIIRNEEE
jgi:hypothetical protein